MKIMRESIVAGVAAGLILICGCGTAPPVASAPATQQSTGNEQAQLLEQQASQFHNQVTQLPGSTSQEHWQIVGAALGNLSKVLELAQGSVETLDFVNHLDLVQASRATITQADVPTHDAEAAENEAIRASIDALELIAASHVPEDHRLPELVQSARGTLVPLYSDSGPMHDLSAAQSLTAVDLIVEQLSRDMAKRLSGIAAMPPARAWKNS